MDLHGHLRFLSEKGNAEIAPNQQERVIWRDKISHRGMRLKMPTATPVPSASETMSTMSTP